MQPWQKELPIHLESKLRPEEKKVLFRSESFKPKKSLNWYQIVVQADYGDHCNNRINQLHVRVRVCMAETNRESEDYDLTDAPHAILAEVANYRALQKWNGCTTAGPWYYIENTVYQARTKDCNGAEKGQYKQIHNGRSGLPSWCLVAIDPDGAEMPVHRLNGLTPASATKPTGEYRVEWRPWWIVGEGKAPELQHARSCAIWPEATDEELLSDDLKDRLAARLPALLVEFRAVVESLGFVW